jgi:hypothetical protein
MPKVTSSPAAVAQYDAVVAGLTRSTPAVAGQMFGLPNLFIDRKAFAGLYGDAMVFKLDGAAHAKALALPGAQRFDPSGRGRPMKAWVQVPLRHAAKWPTLAREALRSLSAR